MKSMIQVNNLMIQQVNYVDWIKIGSRDFISVLKRIS